MITLCQSIPFRRGVERDKKNVQVTLLRSSQPTSFTAQNNEYLDLQEISVADHRTFSDARGRDHECVWFICDADKDRRLDERRFRVQ